MDKIKLVVKFLENNPGYNKWGSVRLSELLNVHLSDVLNARQLLNNKKSTPKGAFVPRYEPVDGFKGNPDNVLIVPDLHAPFILSGFLEWCKSVQKQYNCGKVIFIGDLIDGHSWSYHEHDPDGMAVGDELSAAEEQLQEAYKLFPNVTCLMGNHDLLIARKARTAGLSLRMLKDFREVVGAPKTWDFTHEYTYQGVRYIHGSVGNAAKRTIDSRISTVQGHLHSQCNLSFHVSDKDALFGMQLGAGLDRDKYAFAYAKPFDKKPVISCGVVLNRGTVPMIRLMPL